MDVVVMFFHQKGNCLFYANRQELTYFCLDACGFKLKLAGVKRGELNVATVSNRELPTHKNLLRTNTGFEGVDKNSEGSGKTSLKNDRLRNYGTVRGV